MVTRVIDGRTHRLSLDTGTLGEAADWIDRQRAHWERLIEIDFDERDGATTVRFTHRGLRDEESRASHEDGWGKAFDNLARAVQSS